jgi:hypothetical protein
MYQVCNTEVKNLLEIKYEDLKKLVSNLSKGSLSVQYDPWSCTGVDKATGEASEEATAAVCQLLTKYFQVPVVGLHYWDPAGWREAVIKLVLDVDRPLRSIKGYPVKNTIVFDWNSFDANVHNADTNYNGMTRDTDFNLLYKDAHGTEHPAEEYFPKLSKILGVHVSHVYMDADDDYCTTLYVEYTI